jgi:predicted nucleic acid-binding protein
VIVVADASPLRYLILIEHTHVLPALYGHVIVPPAVITELTRERTPNLVRTWVVERPDWLHVQAPTQVIAPGRTDLGEGEREAIRLALELSADALLVDDRDARHEAERLGVPILGPLRVLVDGITAWFRGSRHRVCSPAAHQLPRASSQLLQQPLDHATRRREPQTVDRRSATAFCGSVGARERGAGPAHSSPEDLAVPAFEADTALPCGPGHERSDKVLALQRTVGAPLVHGCLTHRQGRAFWMRVEAFEQRVEHAMWLHLPSGWVLVGRLHPVVTIGSRRKGLVHGAIVSTSLGVTKVTADVDPALVRSGLHAEPTSARASVKRSG